MRATTPEENQNVGATRRHVNLSQLTASDAPSRIARKYRNEPAFRRRRSSARLWKQLREYCEVRFRAEKYGVPYFLAESEAKRPTERGRRSKSAQRSRI